MINTVVVLVNQVVRGWALNRGGDVRVEPGHLIILNQS
jgi:hypothetical protein